MNRFRYFNAALILFCILSYSVFLYSSRISKSTRLVKTKELTSPKLNIPAKQFGIIENSFQVHKDSLKRNISINTLLNRLELPGNIVRSAAQKAGNLDIKQLSKGDNYYVFSSISDSKNIRYLVYEKDDLNYYVFNLSKPVHVYEGQKLLEVKKRAISGRIYSSLYSTLSKVKYGSKLVGKITDIMENRIDFYDIKKGDEFKIIYEEIHIDNKLAGIGDISAVYIKHDGQKYYAFHFNDGDNNSYFDEEGNDLKSTFLAAPLEYTRISSQYSLKRLHPILKKVRPHFGIDYAAPEGTPIVSIAEGFVETANFSKNNGLFVKIKHNEKYSTQYLHLSRIAPEIHTGGKVKQGTVIGYVGRTGLATGPHLCFRLWKNGIQVDPLNEKLPIFMQLENESLRSYEEFRDKILAEMDSIIIPEGMIAWINA